MELIFVYNAKSDRLNAILDFAHKIVSPSTYACDLCKLTHGNFGEHESWKAFMKTSDIPLTFFHIDEFETHYSEAFTYPIVLKKEHDKLSTFLDAKAIVRINTTEDLITTVKSILQQAKYI